MSKRSVLPLVLIAAITTSAAACNAVLGLDERDRANDAADVPDTTAAVDSTVRGDDGVPFDATRDTTPSFDAPKPPSDSALTDTMTPPPDAPVDAPVSPTCASLGLHCTAGQSCIVSRTAARTYGFGCEPSPPSGTRGGACYFDGKTFKCQEGLACNDAYPTGNICVPLCTNATDCGATPSSYTWCGGITWIASPPTAGLQVCNTCDPVLSGGAGADGCTSGGTTSCVITSSSSPPTCRGTGTTGLGAACGNLSTRCAPGLVCDCGTDLAFTCGGGSTGTCKKVCHSAADCGAVGGTCSPFKAGSSYSLCGP